MLFKFLFLAGTGMSFGLLAAAGVFTVLTAVGLVPRFAGKTHTAKRVFLFEEMVILGTIFGNCMGIFSDVLRVASFLQERFPDDLYLWRALGQFFLAIYGLFGGMFIGCLALAIAEMLDSIPIFARRIGFRHGIGITILSMALGKLCGSLFYFWEEIYRVAK